MGVGGNKVCFEISRSKYLTAYTRKDIHINMSRGWRHMVKHRGTVGAAFLRPNLLAEKVKRALRRMNHMGTVVGDLNCGGF